MPLTWHYEDTPRAHVPGTERRNVHSDREQLRLGGGASQWYGNRDGSVAIRADDGFDGGPRLDVSERQQLLHSARSTCGRRQLSSYYGNGECVDGRSSTSHQPGNSKRRRIDERDCNRPDRDRAANHRRAKQSDKTGEPHGVSAGGDIEGRGDGC